MRVTKKLAAKVLEVVDAGLPHGDNPECVSPALRSLKIALNDAQWSSNAARAKGLRRLAVAQLGSKDALDDKEFVLRVALFSVQFSVSFALEQAANIHPIAAHQEALRQAAAKCKSALNIGAADDAADDAADAADATRATYAAYAAYAAAYAAARAAAHAAADDAAYAAAYAADAAAHAAADAAAADKHLAEFAEGVVKILIEMKTPGCKFLALTE